MPAPLTERQNAAYEFIVGYARDRRSIPTLREIGAALGVKSPNAVTKVVAALVAKGYLEHTPNVARGLRLTDTSSLGPSSSDDAPSLPLLGRISAAAPDAFRRRPESSLTVDVRLLPRSADPDDCVIVRAGDDGMNGDGLRKGDLVVVEECMPRDLRPGELAAFVVGETVQIRTFHVVNGKWHLRAADRRYADETYLPGSPTCALVGRAVAVVRRLA